MKCFLIAIFAAGPAVAQGQLPLTPITPAERATWIVKSTLGVPSLAAVSLAAGFDQLIGTPREYDAHWKGYGERYGLRLAGVAVGNVMEGALGAVIGEDPRYIRATSETPFAGRVGKIIKWTFVAPRRDGELHPAYARFVAIAGSSALQNVWIPDSQSTTPQFLERAALGFASHAAGNAWAEFWPDVKRKVFHHGS